MKTTAKTIFLSIIIFTVANADTSAKAETTMQPGAWQVTRSVEGTPTKSPDLNATLCLTVDQLKTPETTLRSTVVEAERAAIEKSGAKREIRSVVYKVKSVKRDGDTHTWQSDCEHPRNPKETVVAEGKASVSAKRYEGAQTMNLSMGPISISFKEVIKASFVSETCPAK
jgi:hypothetical protein